jgi:hypothetical protein
VQSIWTVCWCGTLVHKIIFFLDSLATTEFLAALASETQQKRCLRLRSGFDLRDAVAPSSPQLVGLAPPEMLYFAGGLGFQTLH